MSEEENDLESYTLCLAQLAITYLFMGDFNNYVEYFQNFSSEQLLLILGLMSTQLGIYTCLFFIDKNDTPCHIFIVFCFGQFSYIFKNLNL